jgi:hypothetical protein
VARVDRLTEDRGNLLVDPGALPEQRGQGGKVIQWAFSSSHPPRIVGPLSFVVHTTESAQLAFVGASSSPSATA